jgi:hypothetical protein
MIRFFFGYEISYQEREGITGWSLIINPVKPIRFLKPYRFKTGLKQKSSPDKSDELEYGENIFGFESDLSVPTALWGWNWHLSVFVLQTRQVVKASSGHYPQPFLISIAVKNLPTGRQARQIYRRNFKTAK